MRTGIIKRPSKRFWAGVLSFFALVALLGVAMYWGRQGTAQSVLKALEFQVLMWFTSLGGGDAITGVMREVRLIRIGYPNKPPGE